MMCFIWNDILQQINITFKAIQVPGIELCIVIKLHKSWLQSFKKFRIILQTMK